jgi:hypothetical protein
MAIDLREAEEADYTDPQERTREAHRRFQAECLRLMQDPAMVQVLAIVRADVRKRSETSEPADTALREHCYYLLNAVTQVEKALRHFGGGGKLNLVQNVRLNGGAGSAA